MKKFWNWVKRFFTFPAGASPGLRLIPYSIVVMILLAVAAGSVAGWEYTNSNTFCGTTCHTMPPQYSTYLRSTHARVTCVECHLGRDLIANQIPRKFAHSHTLIALIFNTYEYPIIAKQMRPARDACETCHYPEKFSDDSLHEVRYHLNDVSNSQESIFLLLKTGGGSSREGLGRGIHWHIEQKVEFLTLDPLEQKIPYIRVTTTDGKVTEYFDIDNEVTLTPEIKLKTMDCITCHNRSAHNILNPADAVDAAIETQKISVQLPSIRAKAIQILEDSVKSPVNLETALSDLKKSYTDQPAETVEQSITALREIAAQISYPEQKLDWTSHPNNIGHKDAPGCFRCHDGKHFSKTGEAVRLECNICHSIPTQADPTQFTTKVSIERGPEPGSHTHSSWILLHGRMLDASCASCHPPADPATDYTQMNTPPPADGSHRHTHALQRHAIRASSRKYPHIQEHHPIHADCTLRGMSHRRKRHGRDGSIDL